MYLSYLLQSTPIDGLRDNFFRGLYEPFIGAVGIEVVMLSFGLMIVGGLVIKQRNLGTAVPALVILSAAAAALMPSLAVRIVLLMTIAAGTYATYRIWRQ